MKLSSITRTSRALGALVGTLATVLATSTPAHAATHYTPDAGTGDAVNFVGSNVAFPITATGSSVACLKFDLAGSIVMPGVSRPFGGAAAGLTALTAANCTFGSFPATVIPAGAWPMRVTGSEVSGISPATLTSVDISVNVAGNCKYYIVGSIVGSFNESTQRFTPSSSVLAIDSTAGRAPTGSLCTFLSIASGGGVTVGAGAYWTNVPPVGSSSITITNP